MPHKRGDLLEVRSCRIHEEVTIDLFAAGQRNAMDTVVNDVDGVHVPGPEGRAQVACALQQVHAHLLGAQPAGPSHMQRRNHGFAEIRKMLANES